MDGAQARRRRDHVLRRRRAIVEFHRTETSHYRDNLAARRADALGGASSDRGADPPYQIACGHRGSVRGRGLTEAGNDIVELVPMPEAVRDALEAFVAEHHVEREFFKRKRDRADTEALGAALAATGERRSMSEPENFLSRWSRRKLESEPSRHDAQRASEARSRLRTRTMRRRDQAERGRKDAKPEEPAFDLTSLPSLESITPETDIRAFLQKGVPADLTRAALRRAWSADPAIRDFIEHRRKSIGLHRPAGHAGLWPAGRVRG